MMSKETLDVSKTGNFMNKQTNDIHTLNSVYNL